MSSDHLPTKMSLDTDISSKKAKKYKLDDNGTEFLKKIPLFFGEEQFCDVTLATENGDFKLKAHRMVLAASSEYFLAMFGGSLKEAQAAEVKFDQINRYTLKTVISFIYTGSIELETNTVENILKAAHLFQLKRLEVTCCDYLTQQLDPSNCLGIALFAEQYSYTELYETCYAFALENFMKLRDNVEFFMLDADQLSKLISRDELRVSSEKEVFHSLILWLEHDRTSREECIAELIQRVRFTLLQPKFIADTVEQVYNFSKVKQLIYAAYKWHLLPKVEQPCVCEEQTKLRNFKDVIIAVSGWNRNEANLNVALYYSGYDDWIYREWPNLPEHRVEFGSTTVDGKLIVAGGKLPSGEASNRVDCLDMRTLKWTKLLPMGIKRYACRMATLNGEVYVIGGCNASGDLSSVEKLDSLLAHWKVVSSMPHSNINLCVGLKGNLLCEAHTCSRQQFYKQLYTYNPLSDNWVSFIEAENDLIGMGTISINDVDHFIIISKQKIKSIKLSDGTATVSEMNLQFADKCAFVGDRLIIYGENELKEYGSCGTLKSLPKLKFEERLLIISTSR